ncbi:MAG: hypothetical protein WB607_23025 [Candidatus Acidiferrum sp.]
MREVTRAGTEIHDDTTFAEIQRLDYIGWTLPMVSLAFDSAQRMESLNALVEIAQQDKQQHSSDQEQCNPNTIGSLDPVIGDRHHERERKWSHTKILQQSCSEEQIQIRRRFDLGVATERFAVAFYTVTLLWRYASHDAENWKTRLWWMCGG